MTYAAASQPVFDTFPRAVKICRYAETLEYALAIVPWRPRYPAPRAAVRADNMRAYARSSSRAAPSKSPTVSPSLVWTNTSVAGTPFSALDHCPLWDSALPDLTARVGYSHLPKQPLDKWQARHDERQWTSLLYLNCDEVARLYCFEN